MTEHRWTCSVVVLSVTSSPFLNTSRSGDSVTSLGSPFQCLPNLSNKKFFLMSNLQLPWKLYLSCYMQWNSNQRKRQNTNIKAHQCERALCLDAHQNNLILLFLKYKIHVHTSCFTDIYKIRSVSSLVCYLNLLTPGKMLLELHTTNFIRRNNPKGYRVIWLPIYTLLPKSCRQEIPYSWYLQAICNCNQI